MVHPNYCVVVGSQRSGTTLTAQILGAHPESVTIDEEDGLYAWTSALIRGEDHSANLLTSATRHARKKYIEPKRRFSDSGVSYRVRLLVLKAPNLTYSWKELASVIPQARVVYVHRNVHAVVASMRTLSSVPIVGNQIRMMSSNEYIADTFSKEITLLRSGHQPAYKKMALVALIKMSLEDKFRKEGLKTLSVQYENLVLKPEESVRRLLEFNGLNYLEQCKNFETQYQGLGPGMTDRTRKLDNRSMSAWKSQLSSREKNEIQAVVDEFHDRHPNHFVTAVPLTG